MTTPSASPRPLRNLTLLTAALLVCFAKPLFDLVYYALHSELFSYILLVPFVSLYLVWQKRSVLGRGTPVGLGWSITALGAGLTVMLGYWLSPRLGFLPSPSGYLPWMILGFYLCFLAACLLCLGNETLREIAFPIGFLAFLVPFPDWLTQQIESFLQHASAAAAHLIFQMSGMPVFRQDLVFQLPGMRLEVAPECSGIHSTLVLLITSLLAAQLFLRRSWSRIALVLAVIPLGVLRNGFRIWVIGELCVHINPGMINSPLHRRGGPLFFVVSLVPLFFLMWYLHRAESRNKPPSVASEV